MSFSGYSSSQARIPNYIPSSYQPPTTSLTSVPSSSTQYNTEPLGTYAPETSTARDPVQQKKADAWASMPRSKRIGVIAGIVIAVVAVIVGVALGVVYGLKKNSNNPVKNLYKCVLDKNNDQHCVVDHTNGTGGESNCCRFTCGNTGCVFDLNGSFSAYSDCQSSCATAEKYDCSNNKCVPTSGGQYDSACCDRRDHCALACTGQGGNDLKELDDGTFATAEPGSGFGAFTSAYALSGTSFMVFSHSVNAGDPVLQVYEAEVKNSQVSFNTTNLYDAAQQPTVFDCGPGAVTIGQVSQGLGVNFDQNCQIGAQPGQFGIFQNGYRSSDQAAVMTDSQTSVTTGLTIFDSLTDFLNQSYVLEDKTTSTDFRERITDLNGTSTFRSISLPSNVIDISQSRPFLFFNRPSSNQLLMQENDAQRSTLTTYTNPFNTTNFLQNLSNFGKHSAVSLNDASVLVVASDAHLVFFRKSSTTSLQWDVEAVIPESNITNLAVSEDGKIVAWTVSDKSVVYAAQTKDDKDGLHDTLVLSIKGAIQPFGVGGLSVNGMANNQYVVTSSTQNENVAYWLIQTTTP